MTARERLVLLIERLQSGPPVPVAGEVWCWPEGDPVVTDGKTIQWLP